MTDDVGAFVPGPRVRIEGRAGGPLSGLTFAAKDLFDVVGSGAVKIDVAGSYPLKEARKAHEDLEARKTTGSLILVP